MGDVSEGVRRSLPSQYDELCGSCPAHVLSHRSEKRADPRAIGRERGQKHGYRGPATLMLPALEGTTPAVFKEKTQRIKNHVKKCEKGIDKHAEVQYTN